MKYLCGICGSVSHPTEEHISLIEEEAQAKRKAPLSHALDVLARLDTSPSTQETIDFVNQPVEEWLKQTKNAWLKKTILAERKKHESRRLDTLYSEAILKSMYGRLHDAAESRPRGMTHKEFTAYLVKKMRELELFRGFHRIWAKNLSRSEIETIYFYALKDAEDLLKMLEVGPGPSRDAASIIRLLHRRDDLDGVQMILLDWEQVNDTNLDESHANNNLSALIKKIDEAGDKIMRDLSGTTMSFADERLERIVRLDAWQAEDNDWWLRPASKKIDEENERFLKEFNDKTP